MDVSPRNPVPWPELRQFLNLLDTVLAEDLQSLRAETDVTVRRWRDDLAELWSRFRDDLRIFSHGDSLFVLVFSPQYVIGIAFRLNSFHQPRHVGFDGFISVALLVNQRCGGADCWRYGFRFFCHFPVSNSSLSDFRK